MISLPNEETVDLYRKDLITPESIAQKLSQWEKQGYDVQGFKLSSEQGDPTSSATNGQTRAIHPNPEDVNEEQQKRNYRVSIPDRQEWEAYVNRLKEEKLRALGVSFGDENLSTSTSPALPSMSRTVSSQSSRATLSPSMAATLASNGAPLVPQLSQQSVSNSKTSSRVPSGASHGHTHNANPNVSHFPRYSVVMPNGGLPTSYQFPQSTSPLVGQTAPSQQYGLQPTNRVGSPIINAPFPNLRATLSPDSIACDNMRTEPKAHNSEDLLGQMHQQQASLQSQHLRQQQLQQHILARPPIPPQARPSRSTDDAQATRYNSQPEIASPVPRGHQQNPSETLQRGIENGGSGFNPPRHEQSDAMQSYQEERRSTEGMSDERKSKSQSNMVSEKPPSYESNIQNEKVGLDKPDMTSHGDDTAASMPRLDAKAPIFEFQPSKVQRPEVFAFGSQLPFADPATKGADGMASINGVPTLHGGLNVGAQPFIPANSQTRNVPSREFSFSSSGPSFKPDAPELKPSASETRSSQQQVNGNAGGGSVKKIFGNIDYSDVIKPAKHSKAIPIVKPSSSNENSGEDVDGQEDESGRITQPEGRQKRIRRHDDDGDQVPLFASPSSPLPQLPDRRIPSRSISPLSANSSENDFAPLETATNQLKEMVEEMSASEVSSLTDDHTSRTAKGDVWIPYPFDNAQEAADFNVALPLQSPLEEPLQEVAAELSHATMEAIRDFPIQAFSSSSSNGVVETRTGESESNMSKQSSHSDERQLRTRAFDTNAIADIRDFATETLLDAVTYIEPSYNEIDAVMKHLNDGDSDLGVERNFSPPRSQGPEHHVTPYTQESSLSHRFHAAGQPRSDAPSPSPNRLRGPYQYLPTTESESADTAEKEMVARNARFSPSYRPSKDDDHHLNSPRSRSISDWDDAVSSGDEATLRARSGFFDHHVHNVVGNVVRRQLGPLENTLAGVQASLALLSSRSTSRRPRSRRTLLGEVEPSDADDEDDDVTSQARLKSPLRDRSYEKLKASIQEISTAQQRLAPAAQLAEVMSAINELKTSTTETSKTSAEIKSAEIKAIVEEAVGRQLRGRSAPVTSSHHSATAEKSQLQITGLESMLKIAETRAEDEMKARRATEDALADNQRLLRSALHEAAEQRESAEQTEQSLASFHEERHETLRQVAMLEGVQGSLEKTVAEVSEKNVALEDTLKEYRLSSTQWRQEIEDSKAENSGLVRTIESLRSEIEASMKGREALRSRLERLQDDMTMAANGVAREQSLWRNKEAEHHAKTDLLSARLEAEARTRERLEVEIERLEAQEKEAIKTRCIVDQTQRANAELERLTTQLRAENLDHQAAAARFKREFHDARESGKLEIQRTQAAMDADIEAARNQVNVVRADLESVVARLQTQLSDATAAAADTRAKHESLLNEISDSHRKAFSEAAEAYKSDLQEHQRFYERTLTDSRIQHERALSNALEDKVRSEGHLNDRLALADQKVAHYADRVAHLEDKLDIAQSAARSAVKAAQSQKATYVPPASGASLPFAKGTAIPEKISPQALRESIIVLQDQLQAREGRIEQLEQQLSSVDTEAPEKLKNRDMEITWLRELLGVRLDDLQDIIGTLSQPSYDREAVKDATIRLKANLQMEQQERERAMAGAQTFPSLTSITNFAASPRALPLAAAAAWGNWKKGRELPTNSLSGIANGSVEQTPSRSSPSAQSFLSGLLTPPSTNTRQVPQTIPKASPSRHVSASTRPLQPYATPRQNSQVRSESQPFRHPYPPVTPPLMRQGSYDQDAQTTELGAEDTQPNQGQSTLEDEPFGPSINAIGNRA